MLLHGRDKVVERGADARVAVGHLDERRALDVEALLGDGLDRVDDGDDLETRAELRAREREGLVTEGEGGTWTARDAPCSRGGTSGPRDLHESSKNVSMLPMKQGEEQAARNEVERGKGGKERTLIATLRVQRDIEERDRQHSALAGPAETRARSSCRARAPPLQRPLSPDPDPRPRSPSPLAQRGGQDAQS